MSGSFHRFPDLPTELQIMVFEEFLIASLNPRIVLLNLDEHLVLMWSTPLLGWQWSVGNREQLSWESPETAAGALLQVNDSGNYVANLFMGRMGSPIEPPQTDALVGLGLSLFRDVFWLPDDLQQFVITLMGPPGFYGETDNDCISNIMIGLDAFEEALGWIKPEEYDFEEADEYINPLGIVLQDVLDHFPVALKIIIMIDVPRGHISWDQIKVVSGNDPALLGLGGDVPGRCHSAYKTYESLNDEALAEDPVLRLLQDDGIPEEYGLSGRALPPLSFAFLRSAWAPPPLPPV